MKLRKNSSRTKGGTQNKRNHGSELMPCDCNGLKLNKREQNWVCDCKR